MKTKYRGLTAAFLLFVMGVFLLPVSALDAADHWYCRHRSDGAKPELPPEFSYLEEHSGYFLDRNADEENKVIYLTFDAGYENGNVGKIVDILNAHEAEGAFFILPNLVKRNPELIAKLLDGGHLICNHSASHTDMTKKTETEFTSELKDLETLFAESTGQQLDPFYRPPEGALNEQNLVWAEKCGYSTVLWSFAYADWDNGRQMPPEKAYEKIVENTHPGMVILLHPTSDTNAAILDRLLTEWEKEGYRFGSLYELCGK